MGAGLPAPLCQQGSRNVAENIVQPRGGYPLWGRGGGGHLLLPGPAGSLCAHVGTRAPRSGRARAPTGPAATAPASGRAMRASLAPAAVDAGLVRPSHAESALAPAWRAAGAGTCRPGPRRCGGGGGGACPGALCPSCPARQHRLIPQPSCRQRRHKGRRRGGRVRHGVRGASPRVASCRAGGGGGGGRACPLWTWWPSAAAACVPGVGIDAAVRRGYLGPPRRGQKHLGAMPEAQPSAGGRGGCSAGGEPCGAGGALGGQVSGWALAGAGPELPPAVVGGENGSATPPPGCARPTLTTLPWSAGRSGLGSFGGL